MAKYGWMWRMVAADRKSRRANKFAVSSRQFAAEVVADGMLHVLAEFRLDHTDDQRVSGQSNRNGQNRLKGLRREGVSW